MFSSHFNVFFRHFLKLLRFKGFSSYFSKFYVFLTFYLLYVFLFHFHKSKKFPPILFFRHFLKFLCFFLHLLNFFPYNKFIIMVFLLRLQFEVFSRHFVENKFFCRYLNSNNLSPLSNVLWQRSFSFAYFFLHFPNYNVLSQQLR